MLVLIFLFSLNSFSQSAGDFQTHSAGNWNVASNWERYDGSSWIWPAPSTPTSADGAITIKHLMTVSASVTVDQVTCNSASGISVNPGVTLTIADGVGTDLTETNATISVDGTLVLNSTATATGGGGSGGATGILSVSSSGTLTLNGTFTGINSNGINYSLSGTANISGTIDGSSTNFSVGANGNVTITGSVTMSSISSIDVALNGLLTVSGNGTLSGTRGNAGNVITVSGTLKLTNNAIVSALNVGKLTVNSGGVIDLGPSTYVSGNSFVLSSGGTIKIGSTVGITTAGATGNVQTTSRTYPTTANYTYSGTSSQVMGNGYPNSITGTLTINNTGSTSDNVVTLDNVRAIANGGSASFVDGILNTNSNLLTFNSGATVLGTPSDLSYVDGPVKKIGKEDFTFPVGDSASGYHPCGIDNTAGAITDSYTAQYYRKTPYTLGSMMTGVGLYGISNCEYWQITRNIGSTSGVTVSWTASSPCNTSYYVTTTVGLVVVYLNGSNRWVQAPGTGSTVIGTPASGTVKEDGVSSFTYFTIGNTNILGSPLPVKFGPLKAYQKQNGVEVEWSTYSGKLAQFEIERSSDGRNFQSIGQVAANNSDQENDYAWFDVTPLAGSNFYRISGIDMTGRKEYSDIIRLDIDKPLVELHVYSLQGANRSINYQAYNLPKGMYAIRVIDNYGRLLYEGNINHFGGSLSQSLELPASLQSGIYYLQIRNNNSSLVQKFALQ